MNKIPKKIRTGKFISCIFCKKNFYIKKHQFETAKYCSRSCKAKATNLQITKNCEICNKIFTHISSRCNKAKYCSTKCYNKAQINKGKTQYTCNHCGKIFIDSLSHKRKYCSKECTNKGNKKTWKAKFSTVRKNMIKRGLLNKCNRCYFEKFPQILGVHHIDRNRHNNELSNLEVLCPNCHSIEHMKHTPHGFKE